MRSLAFSAILMLLLANALASFSSFGPADAQYPTWTVDAHGQADFDTIQEAIDHADNGDSVFVRSGIYYENVVVNKMMSLVGEDVSTTIIDGNGTGHVIHVVSDNVSVTGFTVQKSGNVHWPALEAGICLNGTTDCIILENRAVDNGFCGISLLDSQQNTITRNNVSGTAWGGIHLLNSSRNIVSENILDSNSWVGINGHASSHNNNITENVISNSTYGMFYHDADYNSICRNNISTTAAEGIWLQDEVSFNIVAENRLINNKVAIKLEGPNNNNTLSGNVIMGAEYAMRIQNAQNTRVSNNVIANNRGGNDSWSAGIRLDYGRDSQIHSNIITGNYYGILLYTSSPRVSVYGNNITGNEFGLRVASGGSNNLNVTRNLVANNVGYGIGMTGFGSTSNYATILRNTIVNNSDGIALGQYSNHNTILQNNITENRCGFYIEFSTQNTICNNNMMHNTQQTNVTSGSINTWDSGYPSGGNYWSDHNDTDLFGGVYQNLTGNDGIADLPYVIDADNKDNYPLINPWAQQVLRTDINNDGKVNILDITYVAKAFGSKPEDPTWNEAADLDKNNLVNILDISLVARDFGKTV